MVEIDLLPWMSGEVARIFSMFKRCDWEWSDGMFLWFMWLFGAPRPTFGDKWCSPEVKSMD